MSDKKENNIPDKTYKKVTCGPTVAFDVDDTLVMWDIPEGYSGNLVEVECRGFTNLCIPNQYNIDLLIKFAKRGHAVIVWSGGGADWSEAVINALGLSKYVEVIMGKLTYYIDDVENPKEWIGKHGYFDINGNRIGGDNLSKTKGGHNEN